MREQRRTFTKEFKEDAVRMLNSGTKTGPEIGRDLGLSNGTVYKWRSQLERAATEGVRAFPGNGNPRDEELARLRKELAEVTEERDILRKAVAIFSKVKR